MLNDLEADTAEYILSKFGLIMVRLKEQKYGLSVMGQYRADTEALAWEKYKQIVVDVRIRIPGAFVGGQSVKASDGTYLMMIEVY